MIQIRKHFIRKVWIFLCILFVLILSVSVSAQGLLTYGSGASATLSAEAPIAFFTFSGAQGDQVSVRVFATTTNMQPVISLLSATPQQQLATNNGSPFAPGVAEISYQLPSTGAFTILVSSADGTPGDIFIRLDGTTPPPPVEVAGDSPGSGSLSAEANALIYNIQANPDAPTTVTITTTTPGFAMSAALRDETGATLSILNGSDTQPILVTLAAGTQTYTIEVRPTVTGSSGDIQVSLGLVDAAPTVEATATPSDVIPEPQVTEEVTDTGCTATATGGVNVRTGPGTDYAVISALAAGTSSPVVGTNSQSGWYVIALDGGIQGWVFGNLVTVSGNCDGLQEVAAPPITNAQPTTIPTVAPLQATPTYTATQAAEQQQGATATYTPSYTPTLQSTATYTPSYTPTTEAAPQLAPEDARFNNPLNIPLDSTVSVLDFVSYPGGDVEDRVAFSVTGMNSNVAITGGRARLVISASCFGENTDQIQFFTGGQTYSCGETLVDREVTFDSNTGSIVITAIGGEGTYVQWVLTGTATRVN